jgi:hypothetical protein
MSNQEYEFRIVSLGSLKHDRLKTMSVIKTHFGRDNYSYEQAKKFLDDILNGKLAEPFGYTEKRAIEEIFNDAVFSGGYVNDYPEPTGISFTCPDCGSVHSIGSYIFPSAH